MKIEDISVDKVVKDYYETKRQKRNYDFSKLIKRTYMPYSEKCALVKNIVMQLRILRFLTKRCINVIH